MIYIIKVTTNKEERVLDMVSEKVEKNKIGIFSVARPHGLRGYIFIEGPDREHVEEAVFNTPYVKGIIGKTVSYDEIKNMFEVSIATVNIEKNDIVEILADPFKKEKARVVRVDKQKEEVVVSLLGATVPIPVTVKIDNVKVIRRDADEEEEGNKQGEEKDDN